MTAPALVWQSPTTWSFETTDGAFYIEGQLRATTWALYRGKKFVGRFKSAHDARGEAERLAAL